MAVKVPCIRPSFYGLCLLLSACSLSVPDKHFKLGEEYLLQGQFQRSVEEYSKVVELVPKENLSLTALDRIAEIQRYKLKNPSDAILALRKKNTLASDNETKILTLRQIAGIYKDDLEDPAKAAEEFQQIYQTFGIEGKEGDQILLEYASVLREARLFSLAVTRYQEFLDKFPGHREGPQAMLYLAMAHLGGENYDKAEEALKNILQQFEGRQEFQTLRAEAMFTLGNLYEEKDDLSKAIEFYLTAKETYPNPAVIQTKINALEKRKKEQGITR